MKFQNTLILIGIVLFCHLAGYSQSAVPQGSLARIVGIDTQKFKDPSLGIKRLVNTYLALEFEFKPRHKELENLRKKYTEATTVLSHPEEDPIIRAARIELASRLEREIQVKQKGLETAYEKRVKELTDPINNDIRQFMRTWAKQQGIDIIFDLDNSMLVVSHAVDVTRKFVDDYNAAHQN